MAATQTTRHTTAYYLSAILNFPEAQRLAALTQVAERARDALLEDSQFGDTAIDLKGWAESAIIAHADPDYDPPEEHLEQTGEPGVTNAERIESGQVKPR